LQNILKKLTKENFSAQYKNKQRLQYLRIQFPSRFCVGSAIIGDPSKQFISIQPKNFLAHYNSICNGRITSGYKFRRDLRRIRQNWPSNQTIHLNASKKKIFPANDNKISSGRITSGYSFRRDVAPDPHKVSIHSKNIIQHKQTI
jgi:hypothetical protein